jgi:hypothetical protein
MALLHSPWTPAGRIHLKWDFISRTVSQANSRSKSSLLVSSRLRYPRIPPDYSVFEDLNKEYTTVSWNSPASRTPPTSEQTLIDLVKEGKRELADKVRRELLELDVHIQPNSLYEVIVEQVLRHRNPLSLSALNDWFALLPNADEPGSNAFIGIRKLLLASPREDLPLIKQFGKMCASKGYTYILQNDILPFVSRYSGPQAYAAFVEELRLMAEVYQGKVVNVSQAEQDHTSVGSAVFEDALDEYHLVNSESTPLLPSILSLIEEKLPSILSQPLPHDHSVFEDPSIPEYASYSSAPSLHKPDSLIDHLHSLLHNEEFDEAFRIHNEIRELDMPVPTHSIYFKAASASLYSSDDSPLSQEQIVKFTSWFSLIPPIHQTPSSRTFVKLRERIFNAPAVNAELAMRFSLILASKGFAHHVVRDVFPFIIRFFPLDVFRGFMTQFEEANKEFWTSVQPRTVTFRTRKLLELTRGVAIRTLVSSGRLEEAIGMLPGARSKLTILPRTIYNLLLRQLRQSSNEALKRYIPMVKDVLKRPYRIHISESLRRHRMPHDTELTPMTADITEAYGTPSTGTHANPLEHLKNAVASKHDFPHPDILVSFMETCFNNGDTEAVRMLRNIALCSGFRNASTFLFAEMLFYRRQGSDHLLIQTFVDHFFISGVPQDDVLALHKRIQQTQARNELHEHEYKRTAQTSHKQNPVNRKLWPTQAHCCLVWHSLLRVAPTSAAIEDLYKKLVQLSTHGTYSSQTPSGIHNPSLIPPIWKRNVGAAYFTPFIRPLMAMFGAARGPMVLTDMVKAGLEPRVYHYTELAGQYARTGDRSRAFTVLERMEAMLDKSEVAQQLSQVASSPSTSLPPPDSVVYTSLMAGFVIAKDIQGAEEVYRRFCQRHTYRPGENEALDAVHHRLALLRQKLSTSMPFDLLTMNSGSWHEIVDKRNFQ